MSFPPAQAIGLDNYSDQYGHLVNTDVFVAPGQIGMIVLVEGITSESFKVEKPPGATQAAPTAGLICLIRTYDEAAGPGAPPPLAPGVGVLLPIGLDSPQHLHHVAGTHAHNPHLHGHTGTHLHGAAGTHLHGHAGTHAHAMNIQVGGAIVTAIGFDAGGNPGAPAGPHPPAPTTANTPGNTDAASAGKPTAQTTGNTANPK